jgi:hypothetical protein
MIFLKNLRRFLIIFAVLSGGTASAAVEDFSFSIYGDSWWNDAGKPYGMDFSPYLSGVVSVDASVKNSRGFLEVLGFSLATGSKTWSVADLDPTRNNDVIMDTRYKTVIDGSIRTVTQIRSLYFDLDFKDANIPTSQGNRMSVASSNAFLVQDGRKDNACHECVHVESNASVFSSTVVDVPGSLSAVPEPESAIISLIGLVSLGLLARRSRRSLV